MVVVIIVIFFIFITQKKHWKTTTWFELSQKLPVFYLNFTWIFESKKIIDHDVNNFQQHQQQQQKCDKKKSTKRFFGRGVKLIKHIKINEKIIIIINDILINQTKIFFSCSSIWKCCNNIIHNQRKKKRFFYFVLPFNLFNLIKRNIKKKNSTLLLHRARSPLNFQRKNASYFGKFDFFSPHFVTFCQSREFLSFFRIEKKIDNLDN